MSREALLTVRDLEEYFFCPRMFYYKHVLGIDRGPGLWSDLGREVQEELSGFVEENYRVVGHEVYMESARLRLRGRVDYVVETRDGLAPLEIKYSRRLKPWWKYTIVAYALLVEEYYGRPVKHGYLVIPGPNTMRIDIMDEDRAYVLEAIRNCERILRGEYIPRPYRSPSCTNCDYRDICYKS
jgi:CRISPR-associated exonuclease Cas4